MREEKEEGGETSAIDGAYFLIKPSTKHAEGSGLKEHENVETLRLLNINYLPVMPPTAG